MVGSRLCHGATGAGDTSVPSTNEKAIRKSGIGRALVHQEKALTLNNILYNINIT